MVLCFFFFPLLWHESDGCVCFGLTGKLGKATSNDT